MSKELQLGVSMFVWNSRWADVCVCVCAMCMHATMLGFYVCQLLFENMLGMSKQGAMHMCMHPADQRVSEHQTR